MGNNLVTQSAYQQEHNIKAWRNYVINGCTIRQPRNGKHNMLPQETLCRLDQPGTDSMLTFAVGSRRPD